MRSIVGLVLLIVLVGGCVRPSGSTQQIKRDSVIVMERERIVTTPAERIELLIPIECDSITNKPKAGTSYTRGTEGGTVTLTVDSTGVRLSEDRKACESRIKELEEKLSKQEVVQEVKHVPYTRKIDIICRWLAGILLAWQAIKFIVFKRI